MKQHLVLATDLVRTAFARANSHRTVILWVLLGFIVTSVIHQYMNTAFVELSIRTADSTRLSVFWANDRQNYSEQRVGHIQIFPHQKHYTIVLDDLENIQKLRIDPAAISTTVRLSEISIYQFGYKPIRLRRPGDFGDIKPLRQIESLDIAANGLTVITDGGDPQLEYRLDTEPLPKSWLAIPWRVAVVLGLCGLLAGPLRKASDNFGFVPYAMLLAFTMVFIMASTSRINAHPDEYVHLHAARYYVDHNTPPKACDETTLDSYSPYGVSRLNSTEIAYFLTGKFASELAFLPIPLAHRLRYFNVFLFAVLLIISIRSVPFRAVCIPLLMSPQIWYIFSYINSEGIAIFAALIAVYQLAIPDSALRKTIDNELHWRHAPRILALGALAAVLLLVKKNFYLFGLFAGIWVLIPLLSNRRQSVGDYVRKLAPVFAVALALYGAWLYQHEAVNDFDRTERVAQCRGEMASARFNEHTPADQTHSSLYWRSKGLPFTALFEHEWGTKVFYSGFGNFGYLEVHGKPGYYRAMAVILVLFFIYLILEVLRRGDRTQKLTLLLGIGMFILILGATMWKSWTRDFQPQGRYFFPMIPILGLVLLTTGRTLNPRIVTGFVTATMILSLYFFMFVGLTGIRKY